MRAVAHVAGLAGVMLPFLHVGGTMAVMAEFKRREFLMLGETERITHALMVPAMYGSLLLEPDLASCRAAKRASCGSAGP